MWTITVLIPKGNTYTWVIGLMELIWKVVEGIIDTCLRQSFRLHNVLHGFHTGMGTGKAILELKMLHELSILEQETLLLVFIDLLKAYDTIYRGRLLTALGGYGAGPHMYRLLAVFWDQ